MSGDANGLTTELADLPLERLGRLWMDHVVDDHAGLLTGQFENDRLADPAVAAGDDGDLVLQRHDQLSISHAGLLRPSMHGAGTLRAVGDLMERQHDA